jgi:hypothetical protein
MNRRSSPHAHCLLHTSTHRCCICFVVCVVGVGGCWWVVNWNRTTAFNAEPDRVTPLHRIITSAETVITSDDISPHPSAPPPLFLLLLLHLSSIVHSTPGFLLLLSNDRQLLSLLASVKHNSKQRTGWEQQGNPSLIGNIHLRRRGTLKMHCEAEDQLR